jgi:hypothetical protein
MGSNDSIDLIENQNVVVNRVDNHLNKESILPLKPLSPLNKSTINEIQSNQSNHKNQKNQKKTIQKENLPVSILTREPAPCSRVGSAGLLSHKIHGVDNTGL